jgi:hypothetical protein
VLFELRPERVSYQSGAQTSSGGSLPAQLHGSRQSRRGLKEFSALHIRKWYTLWHRSGLPQAFAGFPVPIEILSS